MRFFFFSSLLFDHVPPRSQSISTCMPVMQVSMNEHVSHILSSHTSVPRVSSFDFRSAALVQFFARFFFLLSLFLISPLRRHWKYFSRFPSLFTLPISRRYVFFECVGFLSYNLLTRHVAISTIYISIHPHYLFLLLSFRFLPFLGRRGT